MLTKLHVRNYRSIEEATLDFDPLTVLVGPNGTGKSNIVDVLRFIRDSLRLGLENAILNRHGMDALRRWSPDGRPYDVQVGLQFEIQDGAVEYTFTLGGDRREEYRVKQERYTGTQRGRSFGYEIREGRWIRPPYDERLPRAVFEGQVGEPVGPEPQVLLFWPRIFSSAAPEARFLLNMSFYTIYPDLLREPQKAAHPYPLDERGQNLAGVLKNLKNGNRRAFEALLEALTLAVPGVSDISVIQTGGYLVTRLHHGESGPVFPLAQESDGTLRLLGLLTALYQSPPRSLLAIEEPELTIHPGALSVLRDVLLEAGTRSQVIITTHSPDLLYGLPAESLRVVEKVDNVTLVGKVSEKQRRAIAEKLFSPGELMRMEGLQRG